MKVFIGAESGPMNPSQLMQTQLIETCRPLQLAETQQQQRTKGAIRPLASALTAPSSNPCQFRPSVKWTTTRYRVCCLVDCCNQLFFFFFFFFYPLLLSLITAGQATVSLSLSLSPQCKSNQSHEQRTYQLISQLLEREREREKLFLWKLFSPIANRLVSTRLASSRWLTSDNCQLLLLSDQVMSNGGGGKRGNHRHHFIIIIAPAVVAADAFSPSRQLLLRHY